MPPEEVEVTALDALAARFDRGAYAVQLRVPAGSRPWLAVANRAVPQMSERVFFAGGAYWWSWGERIAPDAAAAAASVSRVLAAVERAASS